MHFTRGSRERRLKAVSREEVMVSVNALCFPGRYKVMRITGVGVGEEAGTWERRMCGREREA
jgi:hypothetical protein